MTWQPIHADHAIERTRVTLGFDQSPPEKLTSRLGARLATRASELRLSGPNAYTTTLMSPNGPPLVFQGWSFTRHTPDGQLVEFVNLLPTELIYEVGEYGRWELFQERLQEVLAPLMEDLFSVLSLQSTTLEYVDRFLFGGLPTEAAPAELFAPELVASLAERVREGVSLWHLHRGWFYEGDGREILINVNFETQDGFSVGQPARSVAILTRATLSHQAGRDGVESLYADLDLLHDILIDEFSKCLLPEARRSVGLE